MACIFQPAKNKFYRVKRQILLTNDSHKVVGVLQVVIRRPDTVSITWPRYCNIESKIHNQLTYPYPISGCKNYDKQFTVNIHHASFSNLFLSSSFRNPQICRMVCRNLHCIYKHLSPFQLHFPHFIRILYLMTRLFEVMVSKTFHRLHTRHSTSSSLEV